MNQSNYENAIEVIGQAVFELLPPEDPYNDNGRDNVQSLLNCCEDCYCLIQWPDTLEYMEEDWFEEEAILALGSEEKTGAAAYFIPIKRLV